MSKKVDRRRFLRRASVGMAIGTAAGVAALAAESPPASPAIPLPDAGTKVPEPVPAGQSGCCAPAARLIFTCSGSADVGKIADLAARKLREDGAGKTSCLAGIGGRVQGIMDSARAAQTILAIDGCPLHCARNTLEQAGFKRFEHVCLSDLGMVKAKTPVTDEAIAKVAGRGKARLSKSA